MTDGKKILLHKKSDGKISNFKTIWILISNVEIRKIVISVKFEKIFIKTWFTRVQEEFS